MRKLLFSNGSPYARKIRILLAEKGLDYEADVNDNMRPIEEIRPHNPALQVPVLYDGPHHLFGSQVIAQFLMTTYPNPEITGSEAPLAPTATRAESHWDDLLILAATDELTAAVVSFRLYSSGNEQSIPFLGRQRTRIESCMNWLEQRATEEGFWPGTFSLMDINLLCPLLFAEKRQIFHFRSGQWPNIERMVDGWLPRPTVASTPVNTISVI